MKKQWMRWKRENEKSYIWLVSISHLNGLLAGLIIGYFIFS